MKVHLDALARAVALGVLVLVAQAGCGDDSGGGGSGSDGSSAVLDLGGGCATCNGCCDNGECKLGTSASACGFGGLSCQKCKTGEQCLSGTCTTSSSGCSSTSCSTGCCDSNGKCVSPPTSSACGLSGSSCTECKTAEECKSGVCTPTGSGKYDVVVVSAKVSNSDCGFGDDCDPFVEVQLGSNKTVKTPTKDNTETPVWNYKILTATLTALTKETMKVAVKDEDVAFDDTIDTCSIMLKQSEVTSGSRTADCGKKVKALKLTFKATSTN